MARTKKRPTVKQWLMAEAKAFGKQLAVEAYEFGDAAIDEVGQMICGVDDKRRSSGKRKR